MGHILSVPTHRDAPSVGSYRCDCPQFMLYHVIALVTADCTDCGHLPPGSPALSKAEQGSPTTT